MISPILASKVVPKSVSIAVAMSGGVDSSTAAYLLEKKYQNIFGITMYIHTYSSEAIEKAKHTCKALDIPHYVINLQEEFSKKVIEPFKETYKSGKTPNPCAICNREIKFGLLLEQAQEIGADIMATGHYARNINSLLEEAVCKTKDQSYFLCLIKKENLEKIIFPIGEFSSKDDVREVQNNHIPQKESQDICFIPNDTYKSIFDAKDSIEGNIVHEKTNEILGKYKGIYNYTVGQRKGLGISYNKPLYITKIIPQKNIIFVSDKESLINKFEINNVNWIIDMPNSFEAFVKLRYASPKLFSRIEKKGENKVEVTLLEITSNITSGQICAMYDNERVIGGGIIS